MHRIDVISDAVCPWCWIGKRHLDQALAVIGAGDFAVQWRAFQLNPDMPRAGMERDAYRRAKFGSAERGAALDRQVAEAGLRAGLEFSHDLMRRTPSTVQAHRLIRRAEGPGQHALVERLFRAYFAEGEDIGDDAVLSRLAEAEGFAKTRAFLAGDALEADVLAEDAALRRLGVRGVPSFAVEGEVVWSGAIPPERMVEAIRSAIAEHA